MNFHLTTGEHMPIECGKQLYKQELHPYDSTIALLMPERKRSAGAQARTLQHVIQNINTLRGEPITGMQGPTSAPSLIRQGYHPMYSAGFKCRPRMLKARETADRLWVYLQSHGGHNKTTKPVPKNHEPPILTVPQVDELSIEERRKNLQRLRRNRRTS